MENKIPLFSKTTRVFDKNIEKDPERYKLVINQGGGSSSKTYSIIQKHAFYLPLIYPNSYTTVTAHSFPSLTRGCIRDFDTILSQDLHLHDFIEKRVQTPHLTITYNNGSVVEFITIDKPETARYGKRDFLFINEANLVPEEVFLQLYQRTRLQTTLDYNPSGEFWVNTLFLNSGGVESKEEREADPRGVSLIRSTFLDNPYISDGEKSSILSYKESNPYLWEIYGMGNFSQSPDRIYSFPVTKDSIPNEYDSVYFGMDFGFSKDPTTLIECRFLGGGVVYVKEHIYQVGLLVNDMCSLVMEKMKESIGSQNIKNTLVFCDPSNPLLIKELSLYGIPARPAYKAPNSILNGIEAVKSYKVIVSDDSVNLIKEMDNYRFSKGKNEVYRNMPIDSFNHALDALRYCLFTYDKNIKIP